MTPIEKNILVVDAHGNEYEATYPKRAKGLVKSGRARFVDDHTICLACPPNAKLEDSTMSENTNTIQNQPGAQLPEYMTIEYPLRKIDEIAKNQEYLLRAIASLEHQEDGQVVCRIVVARATTNQKLIAFYEKMYDDLKQQPVNGQAALAAELIQVLRDPGTSEDTQATVATLLKCYMKEL